MRWFTDTVHRLLPDVCSCIWSKLWLEMVPKTCSGRETSMITHVYVAFVQPFFCDDVASRNRLHIQPWPVAHRSQAVLTSPATSMIEDSHEIAESVGSPRTIGWQQQFRLAATVESVSEDSEWHQPMSLPLCHPSADGSDLARLVKTLEAQIRTSVACPTFPSAADHVRDACRHMRSTRLARRADQGLAAQPADAVRY